MMRKVLQKMQQGMDGMLPAKVIAATEDRMYAQVKIQIKVVGTNGEVISREPIAKVPVFHIGAGGFVLTFPIKPDSPGWVMASDRDISLYIQSGNEAEPNTARLKSFEDSIFVPDAARLFTLAAGEADSVVLQSLDGTAYISISADQVKIKHPTKLEIETPLIHATGDLTVEGTIRGKTDVLSGAGEISGKTHKHTGVTTGGGTSTGPVN